MGFFIGKVTYGAEGVMTSCTGVNISVCSAIAVTAFGAGVVYLYKKCKEKITNK